MESQVSIPNEERKISYITKEIITEILAGYPEINNLDFSDNLLTTIDNLGPVSHQLQILNLSFNRLTLAAPSNLGIMTQLLHLDLEHNQIASLQASEID